VAGLLTEPLQRHFPRNPTPFGHCGSGLQTTPRQRKQPCFLKTARLSQRRFRAPGVMSDRARFVAVTSPAQSRDNRASPEATTTCPATGGVRDFPKSAEQRRAHANAVFFFLRAHAKLRAKRRNSGQRLAAIALASRAKVRTNAQKCALLRFRCAVLEVTNREAYASRSPSDASGSPGMRVPLAGALSRLLRLCFPAAWARPASPMAWAR